MTTTLAIEFLMLDAELTDVRGLENSSLLAGVPTVLGSGQQIFDADARVGEIRLESVEQNGTAALLRLVRTNR